jgi:AraC-like DNA-binding protein
LSDPAYSQLSILEILHESGFNSKSAFQRFFKRLTGISPREYRRRYCPSTNQE